MPQHIGLLLCLVIGWPSCIAAQRKSDVIVVLPELGVGVDTVPSRAWGDRWKAQVPAIYHRWAEFLASSAPRYTAPGSAPSPYWSTAEQARWISFPLALSFVSAYAIPIVVDVRPATPGNDSVYVVKTVFVSPEPGRVSRPEALVRVYAVREHGAWVFSNALARTTQGWQRITVGAFDYVIPPGYSFNRARAVRGAAFADSVATAFGVPKVSHVSYYLTESPDEMNRIIGLDFYPSSTEGGAFSSGPNRLLVSGNPSVGEDYRHEIVHVVLGTSKGGVHSLVWEGIATWMGGTLGLTATESRQAYAVYLRTHPDVTLDAIFSETFDQGFRPAGAVLCQMVFEHGGVAALNALLAVGPSEAELKAGLQRILGKTWREIEAQWRRDAVR